MLTYDCVRSASRRGLFLVLHPNIALSELTQVRANCCVKRLRSEQSRTPKYAPVHPAGTFLALHPNIALRPDGTMRCTTLSTLFFWLVLRLYRSLYCVFEVSEFYRLTASSERGERNGFLRSESFIYHSGGEDIKVPMIKI